MKNKLLLSNGANRKVYFDRDKNFPHVSHHPHLLTTE